MSEFQIQRLCNVIAGCFAILFILGLSKVWEVQPDPQRRNMSFQAMVQVRKHLACSKARHKTSSVYFQAWSPRKAAMTWKDDKLVSCKLVEIK